MFSKLKKHGVSPRHVTQLIPVTRATASAWLNGRTIPSRHLQPAVDLLIRALDAALEDGVTMEESNLTNVLRKYAKKVKSERKASDTTV